MKKIITTSLIAASLAAFATSANGAAVIYEPFNQTDAETLGGKTAGVSPGTGFTGNWTVNANVDVVAEYPAATYGDLEHNGNKVEMANSPGTWASATISTTALTNDGLLSHGSTLWFSYVFQKSNSGNSNEKSGFGFGTDRVSPAFNGLNMQNSGSGFGTFTNNNSITASSWSGGSRGGNNGVALQNTDPVLADGATLPSFVIGRMVWGADGTADDVLTLWTSALDDIATAPTTGGAERTAVLDQSLFTTISLGQRNSGGIQTYDEIRFGATYADVSPVPEPSSFALLSGCLALTSIMLRRRRD